MARNYSPKVFLRQAPNELLRRYLSELGLDKSVPWDQVSDKHIDAVYKAIENLPEPDKQAIDRDFREIHAMADDGGMRVLLEEGQERHHNVNLSPVFDGMKSSLECAFWTFLEHPDVFRIARSFYYADNIGHWRKLFNLPNVPAATDEQTTDSLAQRISEYYAQHEARGSACHADHYKRGERLYWFCYFSNYAEARLVFDEHRQLRSQTQRPAFEVVFIYLPAEGSLNISVRARREVVQVLQRIFAEIVLGIALEEFDVRNSPYQLDGLLKRTFPFPLEVTDGVEQARLSSLRIQIVGQAGRRIQLDSGVQEDRNGVHDLLDALFAAEHASGDALPAVRRELLRVDRAAFQLV